MPVFSIADVDKIKNDLEKIVIPGLTQYDPVTTYYRVSIEFLVVRSNYHIINQWVLHISNDVNNYLNNDIHVVLFSFCYTGQCILRAE